MTDLLKFVREWADFDKNIEYLFGYLHPTVSCCIPDPQLKITMFKIQLQLQNQVTVTVHHCPVQWRTLVFKYTFWSDMVKFFHMVLTFVLVVIDHVASDEDKRIENKSPLSYAPSVEWSAKVSPKAIV